jgi:hypothetical protein
VVIYAGQKLAATASLNNENHPRWDEGFKLTVCHEADTITFEIKDRNVAGSSALGHVKIPAMQLMEAPGTLLQFLILACTLYSLVRWH